MVGSDEDGVVMWETEDVWVEVCHLFMFKKVGTDKCVVGNVGR